MLILKRITFINMLLLAIINSTAQISPYDRFKWSTYTPMTRQEITSPAMIMREKHNAMLDEIYDLTKYIYRLKRETSNRELLSLIDYYLEKIEDVYEDLENYGINAVDRNSVNQINRDLNNAIEEYINEIEYQAQAKVLATNANNAIKDREYSLAIGYLTRAINLAPKNPDNKMYYKMRGLCYLHGVKMPQNAIDDFMQYSKLCTKSSIERAKSFYYIGTGYEAANKEEVALMYYSACIEGDTTYLDAYYRRANLNSILNYETEAIKDYDYIINYDGDAKRGFDMATVYNDKSYYLIELGKYEEALPLVEKALELNNTLDYIWYTRGKIFYHMREYKKSISDMNNVIKLAIEDDYEPINSYYYRGMSKIKSNQKLEGCKDLQKAKELGSQKAIDEIAKYCK
mgnify:CR=1 FL=1